ncbi:MAG: DUF4857 domain-containing protein [Bacteroidales bacterium]|nr:DUF4857 domain-containing protein [Bacteroidales bacterium]
MRKFANIVLWLTVAVLLLWQLPWLINFMSTPSGTSHFTLYSALADDFIYNDIDELGKLHRYGTDGKEYTEAETDSLLPFFYMRQLVADGRFPDTIMGRAVTPHEVKTAQLIERFNPRDVNTHSVPLYPLLESMPKRVELEMPSDVMRVTDQGVEFIDMESNSIKEDKSARFTQALTDKGFTFPALRVSGNPTTRKAYDEGYLMLDAQHRLYQLKRCAGRPFVKQFSVPDSVQLEHVFEIEPAGRQLRGFATDSQHRFYVLTSDYQLAPVQIDGYDPSTQRMLIIGDLMHWTVSVTTDDAIHYYALSADDYHLVRRYDYPYQDNSLPGLHFTSGNDTYCYPRF